MNLQAQKEKQELEISLLSLIQTFEDATGNRILEISTDSEYSNEHKTITVSIRFRG